MKAKVVWIENLQFLGVSPSGHSVVLDSPEGSNTAPSPMELILIALAGCTGMDVISILKKMKKEISKFEVSCEGERVENHPKIYKNINVNFYIEGNGIDEDSVKRAIELSKEKYCSVGIMLSKATQINYTFKINNKI